ncbi:MAG: hypothetical protein IT463_03755 [Planctomycetes bacterium]|nr:hypothetical protein [Planctomycetota bacterium]
MINPISNPGTDPIFRSQQVAFQAINRHSATAGEAGQRLNTGERILNPGDDPVAFRTSRTLRAQVSALNSVLSAGQVNLSGLSIAQDGLSKISSQLENLKGLLTAAQSSSSDERADLQQQIDAAVSNIDSTARNARFGGRSLLDGGGTVRVVASVTTTGTVTELYMNRGSRLSSAASEIVDVRVNRIGVGLPTRSTTAGDVMSLKVLRLSGNGAFAGAVRLSMADAFAASESVTLRITGNRGSTVLTIAGSITGAAGVAPKQRALIQSFNALAEETGVVLVPMSSGGTAGAENELVFKSLGADDEAFVKVEILASNTSAVTDVAISQQNKTAVAGQANVTNVTTSNVGASLVSHGKTGSVLINGEQVEIGGEHGTTARYLKNGFDIEIDLGLLLAQGPDLGAAQISRNVNILLADTQAGILGPTAGSADLVMYGFRNVSASTLGKGGARLAGLTHQDSVYQPTVFSRDTTLGDKSLAELKTGGRLDLDSGKFAQASKVIERSLNQVLREQARLGTLQGQFTTAIDNSSSAISTLASAEADINSIDTAAEVTKFTQAQLGLNTAASVLRGSTIAQQTVLSLLQ